VWKNVIFCQHKIHRNVLVEITRKDFGLSDWISGIFIHAGIQTEKKNYVDAHTHARKIGTANNFKIFGGNINPKGINRTDYWEDDTLRLIIHH